MKLRVNLAFTLFSKCVAARKLASRTLERKVFLTGYWSVVAAAVRE